MQKESKKKQEKIKQLVIMRGISGSGKSTLSAKIIKDHNDVGIVLSTDDFFIQNGKYQFDSKLLGEAHVSNQARCEKAMNDAYPLIIIDNTHTQKWEAKPYVQMGIEYGYDIAVAEPSTSWAKDAIELAKRNQHGVPLESIKRMLSRWEDDFTVDAILKSKPPRRK